MKKGLITAIIIFFSITCVCIIFSHRIQKLNNAPYAFPNCLVIDSCRYTMTSKEVSDTDTGIIKTGIIQSSVKSSSLPTEHQSSNFGFPYEYRLMEDHTVDIFYGDKWIQCNLVDIYLDGKWVDVDDIPDDEVKDLMDH